jgi:hypothetical protein
VLPLWERRQLPLARRNRRRVEGRHHGGGYNFVHPPGEQQHGALQRRDDGFASAGKKWGRGSTGGFRGGGGDKYRLCAFGGMGYVKVVKWGAGGVAGGGVRVPFVGGDARDGGAEGGGEMREEVVEGREGVFDDNAADLKIELRGGGG